MKRHLLPIMFALAFALAFPAPSHAFKGCAIGLHTGASAAHSEISTLAFDDNTATVSALIGTSLSCHVPVSTSGFYAGAQADIDFYKRVGDAPAILGTAIGTAPSRRAALVGQLGYMANAHTGIYLEAGWGWSWDKDLELGPGMSIELPTYQGPVAGVGMETEIGVMRFTVSYRAAFYQDQDTTAALGSFNREPQDHTVRLGLKFPFLVPAVEPAAKAKGLK